MANELTPLGLTVNSVTDIVNQLTADMQSIYGSDINVDSNSPDGQLINIYAQVAADMLQLLVSVFDSFSTDGAVGTVLDQRVAINGLARKQGTFTTTPVLVSVGQALTLPGLDQTTQTPFTVSDNAGNQFQLAVSHTFSGAGSASLTFQAVSIGAVEVTVNTITNIVTATLGVNSVNNPTTSGTVVGTNEETDAQLRVRHTQSFALAATGPADSVSAALLALANVTDAYVVENVQDTTVNTVPPHAIWCIVKGGTASDIAHAIYAKKGIGCDMKGSQTLTIARPNGTNFTAKWDNALAETLYIRFTITGRVPTAFDTAALATALAAALIYKLGQSPTIGDVITAMQTIAPTGYLTLVGVSTDNANFFDVVTPSDAQHYFTVLAANITIST